MGAREGARGRGGKHAEQEKAAGCSRATGWQGRYARAMPCQWLHPAQPAGQHPPEPAPRAAAMKPGIDAGVGCAGAAAAAEVDGPAPDAPGVEPCGGGWEPLPPAASAMAGWQAAWCLGLGLVLATGAEVGVGALQLGERVSRGPAQAGSNRAAGGGWSTWLQGAGALARAKSAMTGREIISRQPRCNQAERTGTIPPSGGGGNGRAAKRGARCLAAPQAPIGNAWQDPGVASDARSGDCEAPTW